MTKLIIVFYHFLRAVLHENVTWRTKKYFFFGRASQVTLSGLTRESLVTLYIHERKLKNLEKNSYVFSSRFSTYFCFQYHSSFIYYKTGTEHKKYIFFVLTIARNRIFAIVIFFAPNVIIFGRVRRQASPVTLNFFFSRTVTKTVTFFSCKTTLNIFLKKKYLVIDGFFSNKCSILE